MSEGQNTPFQGSAGFTQSIPEAPTYPKPPRTVVAPYGRGAAPYTGPNLVNSRNQIERQPYDLTDEFVRYTYGRMTPQERAQTFSTLQRYGFYGSSDPGVFNNDLNAIERWLAFSNTIGVTADRALTEMQRTMNPISQGGGGMRRYRVSNPDDIKTVINKAAMDTIGRAFTQEELALAVPGYQQAEVKAQQAAYSGGVSVEAPSATTFGQQAAQFFQPDEANGYKFLKIMNRIFSATSGGM